MEWFQKFQDQKVEDFDYLLKNIGTTHRGRMFVFIDLKGNEIFYDIPEKFTRKDYDFTVDDVVKFRSLSGM
jgi:hypothetical protein